MESVNEIKEALSARSRTATLDELRSEGRKRVRLIRAEHVAAMITEAVHSAVEHSGFLSPAEVEGLVEKSRIEFRSILREREQELQRARDVEEQLQEREAEVASLNTRLLAAENALAEANAELDARRTELAAARDLIAARGAQPAMAAPAAAPSSDMLLALVQEMATLKANLLHQQQAPAAAASPAGVADFSAAIEKLAGSLNDRLETLGKKMGISSAVGGDGPVDFGGLFRDADTKLESNMENIQVKQTAGGGIAANLARLKKLKGGG